MAKTVSTAFNIFLTDFVRIDKGRNDVAKVSKKNLIAEIMGFPDDGRFFKLKPDMPYIDYGSFSRKTKIRELDDIDIMIVMHAEGNYRVDNADGGYKIRLNTWETRQDAMVNQGTDVVNSIKVVNRFKDYLKSVASYEKADIKRNQEAATLKLKSYEWVYDIVPCFKTAPINGRDFFLIPDGNGNWKPTDPRIDKDRITRIHGNQAISVLDVIRLMKYWTKRRTASTMGSYFLECLILDYYDSNTSGADIDVELKNMFAVVYDRVHHVLNDPKGFQGDLNTLSWDERNSIQARAKLDCGRAEEAVTLKNQGKPDLAIAKWIEIFGADFPIY